MLKHLSYILLLPVLLCMVACSSDTYDEQGEFGFPDLRITTAPSPIIGGEHPNVADKHELIHHYTLVYVNKDTRRVEALRDFNADGEGQEYRIESFPIEITEAGGIDRHAYAVYAFANFTPAMKEKVSFAPDHVGFTLSTLTTGMVLPANYDQAISSALIDLSSLNGHDFTQGTEYVPMTAVVSDYQATMQYHQPKNIPLVRMLAKVQFKVCNLTGADVKLTQISMTPITASEVYVLPHIATRTTAQTDAQATQQSAGYYPERPATDALRYVPQFPSTPTTTQVELNLSTPLTIPNFKATPTASNRFVDAGTLYLNESSALIHPTKHFAFSLTFTKADGTVEQYRYALSGNDFTSFCRNDYVVIPLTISDEYSLEPEVFFYPPIGGYPPVISSKSDEEFYCTFSTEGDFAIYPTIYRHGAPTGIFLSDTNQVESYTITVTDEEGNSLSAGSSIFSKLPAYSAPDHAILGTLNNNSGHAIVTISVTMRTTSRTLTKKVHVIR